MKDETPNSSFVLPPFLFMSLAIIILAAGKGTRMKSELAKVLHSLGGKPLIAWALDAVAPLRPDRTILIVGHQAERSEEHTSELQSLAYLVCRLLLEKKKKQLLSLSTTT